jgi:hypothetical protein
MRCGKCDWSSYKGVLGMVGCDQIPGVSLHPYKDGCGAREAFKQHDKTTFDRCIHQMKVEKGLIVLPPAPEEEKKEEETVPQPSGSNSHKFKLGNCVALINNTKNQYLVIGPCSGERLRSYRTTMGPAYDLRPLGHGRNKSIAWGYECHLTRVSKPPKSGWTSDKEGDPRIKVGSTVLVCESTSGMGNQYFGKVAKITSIVSPSTLPDAVEVKVPLRRPIAWLRRNLIYICD